MRILLGSKTKRGEAPEQVVQAILPFLSHSAATQVRRVLAGETDALTFVARLEVTGMITGYMKELPLQ
jgi:hypothetical protein